MAPASAPTPYNILRQARRLQALRPTKPNKAGNTKAAILGDGVCVWICIALIAGVHVSLPLVAVVQLACTLTGVKVQVVLTGSPLH